MPSNVRPAPARLLEIDGLRFTDFDEFRPDFTPRRMLELGVYGGFAFRGDPELSKDLPQEWAENARLTTFPTPSVNCFGVIGFSPIGISSLDGEWFRWYCHFSEGRRSTEDRSRIEHWLVTREIYERRVRVGSGSKSKIRQQLLEYACDPQPDLRD